jgi:hypothetical protein
MSGNTYANQGHQNQIPNASSGVTGSGNHASAHMMNGLSALNQHQGNSRQNQPLASRMNTKKQQNTIGIAVQNNNNNKRAQSHGQNLKEMAKKEKAQDAYAAIQEQ